MYVDAYANRKDIPSQLSTGLKCDALLVVGSKTSHVAAAEHMYQNLNKVRIIILKTQPKQQPFKLLFLDQVQPAQD